MRKRFMILNLIRHNGSISKFDIAKATHLSKTTVGYIIDKLIERGLIKEKRLGESSGGRRPVLVELNSEVGYAIGLDFEANHIWSVMVNFKGEIIASAQGKIMAEDDKLTIVKKIIDTIHKVIDKSKIENNKILGIGIGAPGLIDSKRGISISYYTLPNWRDVYIGDLVRYEFELPIYIEKNIRTMALAEKRFGRARNVDNMICIGVRSGMGLGIVINGTLFKGVSESAGEIGHITVDKTGPKCRCGNRGCLQELASGHAIIRRLRKQLKNGRSSKVDRMVGRDWERITLEEIIQAAKEGDELALDILAETGDYIGIALANVINLFNPELIILAGYLVEMGDLVLEPIKKTVKERALEVSQKNLRIELSELGDSISALGASALILSENIEVFENIWKSGK